MVETAFFMLYPSGCAYLSAEIYIWHRSQASGYGKLFKNPCSQAELNKIVPFGFSLQRQKKWCFFAIKIV
mgnify:CR=1 FL=1